MTASDLRIGIPLVFFSEISIVAASVEPEASDEVQMKESSVVSFRRLTSSAYSSLERDPWTVNFRATYTIASHILQSKYAIKPNSEAWRAEYVALDRTT